MTGNRFFRLSFGLPALVIFGLGLVANLIAADPVQSSEDMICGPRCLLFILRQYNREADLIGLVKEVQWPDLEVGASLERIEKCLNRRGIYTAAIRFSPGRRFIWTHPVLLFIDEGGQSQGHYVVRVPGSSPDYDDLVWAGVEGWRQGSWEDATGNFSGLALLTSPKPITDVTTALGPLPPSSLIRLAGLALAGAIAAHLSLQFWNRLRRQSQVKASVSL